MWASCCPLQLPAPAAAVPDFCADGRSHCWCLVSAICWCWRPVVGHTVVDQQGVGRWRQGARVRLAADQHPPVSSTEMSVKELCVSGPRLSVQTHWWRAAAGIVTAVVFVVKCGVHDCPTSMFFHVIYCIADVQLPPRLRAHPRHLFAGVGCVCCALCAPLLPLHVQM